MMGGPQEVMVNDLLQKLKLPALEKLRPGPSTELLRHALLRGSTSPERRVFVNRTLRMETINHMGFDLDWTLAPYYSLPFGEATFTLALDRLVDRGYPEKVLQAEFRPHYPHRGLIVDREKGTILKMNRHRYVGRAFLGRRLLNREERSQLYRRGPLDLSSERFYHVDTLYEVPEVNLYVELAELAQHDPSILPDSGYSGLFADVRECVDSLHADGTLKSLVVADLPRFLPREKELVLALLRLRLGKRKLFLVTNSDWEYSNTVLKYLLEGVVPGVESWRELFDVVIVSAKKPDFFRRRHPFIRLDEEGRPGQEVPVPEWGGIFQGGSREGVMDLLRVPGEQVLYVGDHLYGDIVSSKITGTWRTALIAPELEDELLKLSRLTPQLRHLRAVKSELSEMGQQMDDLRDVLTLYDRIGNGEGALPPEIVSETRVFLDDLQTQHYALRKRAEQLRRRISDRLNPTWGSVFRQGGSKSLFGGQTDDFACLYTSRVANFAFYGTNHYYRVLRDPMIHEMDL